MSEDGDGDDEGRSLATWLLIALAAVGFLLIAAVIGSAVVASFVLGVGDDVETSPTATFSLQGDDPVTVTHDGGDAMGPTNLVILRNGERLGTWASLSDGSDEDVTAGDDLALPSAERGDEITLVWDGEDQGMTLAELTVRGP